MSAQPAALFNPTLPSLLPLPSLPFTQRWAHLTSPSIHAGLLINFDCSCMWFREGRAAWAREALSVTPEYLRHHANDLDYKARRWLWMLSPPSLWSAIAFTLASHLADRACTMISTVLVHCRPPPAPQDLQVPLGRKFR